MSVKALSFEDGLSELAPTLESLRVRLAPELGIKEFPDAKILWKVMSLYQCVIRRTLELIEGIEHSWRQQQYLICVTLARSLVETAAFTWNVTGELERGVEEHDLGIIDNVVTSQTFATRNPSWLCDKFPQVTNILTLISKMDRNLVGGPGTVKSDDAEAVLGNYHTLSDFSHPNWLGVTSMYATLDKENSRYLFGPAPQKTDLLGTNLGAALASVLAVEVCLRRLGKVREPIREMNKVVPYKR